MRAFTIVLGLASLHQAAAVCCRSNKCLKAIGQLGDQGIADCSAALAVTITPEAVTFTETASTATEYPTVVGTQVVTVTETTTASTETDVFVVSETVTASTETQVQFVTETAVATEMSTELVTVTPTFLWRRTAAESSPAALPTYPLECPSWEKYTAACLCASITPVTVTADALSTTVTVGVPGTVTSPILSTLLSTDTVLESVTATTIATTTDVVSLTATTQETSTVILDQTITIGTTETTTAPAPTKSLITTSVTAFLAVATDDATASTPLYIHADFVSNTASGPVSWIAPPTSAADQGDFLWRIDGQGRVLLATTTGTTYALYAGTAGTGIVSVLVNTFDTVQAYVTAGRPLSFVYGAVDPVTKELLLKAGGRRTVLLCDTKLYLSNGAAEDTATGVCKVMHPHVAAPLF